MLSISSDLVDVLLLDALGWKMRVSTLRILRVLFCILSVLAGGTAFITLALVIGSRYESAIEYGSRPPILMLAVLIELYATLVPILSLATGSERDWLTHGSYASLCRALDISQSSMVIAHMLPRTVRGLMTSFAICSSAAALLVAWGAETPVRLGLLFLLPVISSMLPVTLALKIACDGRDRTRLTWGYALPAIAIPVLLGVATAAIVLALVRGALAAPTTVGTMLLSTRFELLSFLACLSCTGVALGGLVHYFRLLDGAGFRIMPVASRPGGLMQRNAASFLYPMKALVGSPNAPELVRTFGVCLGVVSFLEIAAGPLLPIVFGIPPAGGVGEGVAMGFCYVCLMYSLGIADGISRAIGPLSLLAAWRTLWEWGSSVRSLVLPAFATWTLAAGTLVLPLMAVGPLLGVPSAHVAAIGLATMMSSACAGAAVGQGRTSPEADLRVAGDWSAAVAVLSLFLSVMAILASFWYAWGALAICASLYGGTFLCLRHRIRYRQLDLSI